MKVRSFAKRALSIVASVAMLLSCTVFSGMFGVGAVDRDTAKSAFTYTFDQTFYNTYGTSYYGTTVNGNGIVATPNNYGARLTDEVKYEGSHSMMMSYVDGYTSNTGNYSLFSVPNNSGTTDNGRGVQQTMYVHANTFYQVCVTYKVTACNCPSDLWFATGLGNLSSAGNGTLMGNDIKEGERRFKLASVSATTDDWVTATAYVKTTQSNGAYFGMYPTNTSLASQSRTGTTIYIGKITLTPLKPHTITAYIDGTSTTAYSCEGQPLEEALASVKKDYYHAQWFTDSELTTPAPATAPAADATYYGKWRLNAQIVNDFKNNDKYGNTATNGTYDTGVDAKSGDNRNCYVDTSGSGAMVIKRGANDGSYQLTAGFRVFAGQTFTADTSHFYNNNGYTRAKNDTKYLFRVYYKAVNVPTDMYMWARIDGLNWGNGTSTDSDWQSGNTQELIRAGRVDDDWQVATFVENGINDKGFNLLFNDVNHSGATNGLEIWIDKVEICYIPNPDTTIKTVTFMDGETNLDNRSFVAGEEMSSHPFDGVNKLGYDLTGWVDENGAPMPSLCPETDATYYVTWSLMQKPLYMKHDFGVTATYGDTTGYTEVSDPRPTGADDGNRNNNSSRANVDMTDGYMRLYRGKGDGAGYLSSAFRILADSADNYRADLTTTTNKTTAGLDYYVKIGYKSVQAPVALRLWVELSSGWRFGSGGMSLSDHTSYQTSGQLVIPAGTVDTAWQEAAFMVHANTAEAINLFFDEADGSNCASPKEVWIDYVEVYVVVPDNKVEVIYQDDEGAEMATKTAYKGYPFPAPSIATPTKANYTFCNWVDTDGNPMTDIAPSTDTVTYRPQWAPAVSLRHDFNSTAFTKTKGTDGVYASSNSSENRGFVVNDGAMEINLTADDSSSYPISGGFRVFSDDTNYTLQTGLNYNNDDSCRTKNGNKYLYRMRYKALNVPTDMMLWASIAGFNYQSSYNSDNFATRDDASWSKEYIPAGRVDTDWQYVSFVVTAPAVDKGFHIMVDDVSDENHTEGLHLIIDYVEVCYLADDSMLNTVTFKAGDDTLLTRTYVLREAFGTNPVPLTKIGYDATDTSGWLDEDGEPMPSVCAGTATYHIQRTYTPSNTLYMKHDYTTLTAYGKGDYIASTGGDGDDHYNTSGNISYRATVHTGDGGYMRLYRAGKDGTANFRSADYRVFADSDANYNDRLSTVFAKTVADFDYYIQIRYKPISIPVNMRLGVGLVTQDNLRGTNISTKQNLPYTANGYFDIPAGTYSSDDPWQTAGLMVHANSVNNINIIFDEATENDADTTAKELWIDWVEVHVVVPENKVDVIYMDGNQKVGENTGLFKGMPMSVSAPTVTKKGWTFADWYDAPEGGSIADLTVAPEVDPTYYYARWTDNVTKVLETGFQDGENGLKIYDVNGQVTENQNPVSYVTSTAAGDRGGKGSNNRYCAPAAVDGETGNIAMQMNLEPISDETQVASAFRIFADREDHIYDSGSDKLTQNGTKAKKDEYYQISFRVKAVNLTQSVRIGAVIASQNWGNKTTTSGLNGQWFVHTIGAETNGDWQQVTGVLKADKADAFSIFVLPGKDGIKNGDTILVDDIEISYVDSASDVTTITLKDGDDTATRQFVANHPMPLPDASVRMAYDFLNWCTDETYSEDAPEDAPASNTTYFANLSLKIAEWSLVHFVADTSGTCVDQMFVKNGDPIPFPTVTYSDYGWKYDANEWYTDAAFTNAAPATAPGGEVTYYNKRAPILQDFQTLSDASVLGNGSVTKYGVINDPVVSGNKTLKWKMNQEYRQSYARWVVDYNGGSFTTEKNTGYKITMRVYSTVTDTFYPRVGTVAKDKTNAVWGDNIDSVGLIDVDNDPTKLVDQNGTNDDIGFPLEKGEWTTITFTSAAPTPGRYLTIGGGFSDKYDGGDDSALSPEELAYERAYKIKHKELAYVYVDDVQIEKIDSYIPVEGAADFESYVIGKSLELNPANGTEKATVSDDQNHTLKNSGASKSLKVTGRNGGGDLRAQFVLTNDRGNKFYTQEGYTYTVSVWVYSEDTNTFRMWLAEGDDTHVFQQTTDKIDNITYRHNRDSSAHIVQTENLTLTTGEWTKFTLSFKSTAPAEGDVLRLGISETTGSESYTYYIDDISVDAQAPYIPTPGLWDMETMKLDTNIALNSDTKDAATVSSEANHTVGGSKSLRIDSNDGSGDNRTQFILCDSNGQPVEVYSGTTYYVSFWAMTTMTSDTTMRFWIADGDETTEFQNNNRPDNIAYRHNRGSEGHLLQGVTGMSATLTTGVWQQFWCVWTPQHVGEHRSPTQNEGDPSYIRIGISHTNGTNSPHVYYVDDFTMFTDLNAGADDTDTPALLNDITTFGLYTGGKSGIPTPGAGSAIYTVNSTEYCAIRPIASYKTASAACDTIIVGGDALKIKERGILFNRNYLSIDLENKLLYSHVTKNFDACWSYDPASGTCKYSLLIKDISQANADQEWKFRSYMKVDFHGTPVTIYSGVTYSTVDAIHEAANTKTGKNIGWFSN